MKASVWGTSAAAALCMGLLAAGCQTEASKKAPGVMVVLRTDMEVPEGVASVGVYIDQLVDGQSRTVLSSVVKAELDDSGRRVVRLPGELAVQASGRVGEAVRVQVVAFSDGQGQRPLVVREARVSMPEDRVMALPLPLLWMNRGDVEGAAPVLATQSTSWRPQAEQGQASARFRSKSCGPEQTLGDSGACESIDVPLSALHEWGQPEPQLPAPEPACARSCFNVTQCFLDQGGPADGISAEAWRWQPFAVAVRSLDAERCGAPLADLPLERGTLVDRFAAAADLSERQQLLAEVTPRWAVAVETLPGEGGLCLGDDCLVVLNERAGARFVLHDEKPWIEMPPGICWKIQRRGVMNVRVSPRCHAPSASETWCERAPAPTNSDASADASCRDGYGWMTPAPQAPAESCANLSAFDSLVDAGAGELVLGRAAWTFGEADASAAWVLPSNMGRWIAPPASTEAASCLTEVAVPEAFAPPEGGGAVTPHRLYRAGERVLGRITPHRDDALRRAVEEPLQRVVTLSAQPPSYGVAPGFSEYPPTNVATWALPRPIFSEGDYGEVLGSQPALMALRAPTGLFSGRASLPGAWMLPAAVDFACASPTPPSSCEHSFSREVPIPFGRKGCSLGEGRSVDWRPGELPTGVVMLRCTVATPLNVPPFVQPVFVLGRDSMEGVWVDLEVVGKTGPQNYNTDSSNVWTLPADTATLALVRVSAERLLLITQRPDEAAEGSVTFTTLKFVPYEESGTGEGWVFEREDSGITLVVPDGGQLVSSRASDTKILLAVGDPAKPGTPNRLIYSYDVTAPKQDAFKTLAIADGEVRGLALAADGTTLTWLEAETTAEAGRQVRLRRKTVEL